MEDTGNDEKFNRREFFRRSRKWIVSTWLVSMLGASELVQRGKDATAVVDIFGLKIPETGSGVITKVVEYFSEHGNQVSGMVESAGRTINPVKFGQERTVRLPVNSAITVHDNGPDRLGNPQAEIRTSREQVEKIVAETDAKVIVMSFELGKTNVKLRKFVERPKDPELGRQRPKELDGNYLDAEGKTLSKAEYDDLMDKINEQVIIELESPDLLIEDGYAGKNTEKNFAEMFELARKFPEKTFVVAGGNPNPDALGGDMPDLRKAREMMRRTGVKLDNLIIVGVEYDRQGYVRPGGLGADVYVNERDLKSLGGDPFSSFATPVVAEMVQQFGKTKVLGEMTETKEWWGPSGNERMEYKVVKIPNVTGKKE